jgi:hypothetical protein
VRRDVDGVGQDSDDLLSTSLGSRTVATHGSRIDYRGSWRDEDACFNDQIARVGGGLLRDLSVMPTTGKPAACRRLRIAAAIPRRFGTDLNEDPYAEWSGIRPLDGIHQEQAPPPLGAWRTLEAVGGGSRGAKVVGLFAVRDRLGSRRSAG